MKELLDLSTCKTNKEVSTKIKERVLSVKVEELITALNTNFIFHEEQTKKIYAALATNNNAILYGPGGFGKSVLIEYICKYLGLPVVYKTCYQGMMPDELFGVPNMKVLMEESRYETAFENSLFSQPGILILEEFMDSDKSTGAALKDIITSKGLRENGNKKESLIASIIITGNKNPEDIPENDGDSDSIKAFYLDRFLFRHNTIWKSFSETNYLKYFKVFFGEEIYENNYNKLIFVARICAGTDYLVSPRVAAGAASVALELGVEFLDTVSGIDTSIISNLKYDLEEEDLLNRETNLLNSIKDDLVAQIDFLRLNPDVHSAIAVHFRLQILKEAIEKQEFSDKNMHKLTEIFTLLEHCATQTESISLNHIDTEKIQENVQTLFSDDTKT